MPPRPRPRPRPRPINAQRPKPCGGKNIFKICTLTFAQYALRKYTIVLHLHNVAFANLSRNIHPVIFAFAFIGQHDLLDRSQ